MKKTLLILFPAILWAYALTAQKNEGANYRPDYKYSPSQLQYDFIIFRWLLEKIHPGLDWYAPKAILNRMMDSTYTLLKDDSLTERQFYQLLTPIVAQVHCGHTILDPSYFYQDLGTRFPLDLKFIQGKAYILYDYTDEHTIPLGAQVLSINGEPMEEIVKKLFRCLSSDATQDAGKYSSLDEDFQNYYDLIIAQPDTFVLECIDYGSKERITLKIPSMDSDKLRSYNKRYIEDLTERKTLGLKILEDDLTAILEINSFYPVDIKFDKQKYYKFIKKAFAKIKGEKIQNLIIDLRRNGGGEMLYVNELFSYLAKKTYRFLDRVEVSTDHQVTLASLSGLSKMKVHNPRHVVRDDSGKYVVKAQYYNFLEKQQPKKSAFQGDVYVLISDKSFSAGSFFATLAYSEDRAIFVGEEGGGGAFGLNGGDFVDIALPNTSMLLEIPVEKWVKEIPNYPYPKRGIIPQHQVFNTIEDLLAGKDRVVEYTLDLIRKKKASNE